MLGSKEHIQYPVHHQSLLASFYLGTRIPRVGAYLSGSYEEQEEGACNRSVEQVRSQAEGSFGYPVTCRSTKLVRARFEHVSRPARTKLPPHGNNWA
jgi:hypothetical protein